MLHDSERIFGKHRAHVVDNKDPDQKGRVKVICPSLFPEVPQVDIPSSGKWEDVPFGFPIIGWCEPALPFGEVKVPTIGTRVWIEFEGGNPAYPLWVGVWYTSPNGETPIHPDFAVAGSTPSAPASPTNRIIHSAKHTIILDDKDGVETVTIKHDNGEFWKIDENGKMSTNSNATGSSDFFVLKTFITAYMDTHAHTGNLGAPTGPPILTSGTFSGVGLATDKV